LPEPAQAPTQTFAGNHKTPNEKRARNSRIGATQRKVTLARSFVSRMGFLKGAAGLLDVLARRLDPEES
jgi:hypothetical protein